MKKFLVLMSLILLVVGFFGIARAQYICEDPVTVDGEGFNGSPWNTPTITWEHYLEPCCGEGLEGGYGGYEEVSFVSLTIVADDVDNAGTFMWGEEHDGEQDMVFMENGELTIPLGNLAPFAFYTPGRPGYTSETGPGGMLSTTIFDSEEFEALLALDFSLPITVRVEVEPNWGVEIETSTLTVACASVPVPSTLFLLGSGIIGLVGLRRKIQS